MCVGGGGRWGAHYFKLNKLVQCMYCACQQGMVFTNKDVIVKWGIYDFITLHPEKGCT